MFTKEDFVAFKEEAEMLAASIKSYLDNWTASD
jgi:hypothetical protein